jgi:GNAT superfamily N-acetyltransferase
VSGALFPAGFTLLPLERRHPRADFDCGRREVNAWLATLAYQHQEKRLSATKVLCDPDGVIAGFYTLATGQVDFGELPAEIAHKLPRRAVPVAILAWLGVSQTYQGQKRGDRLLAQALRDCHHAGQTFAFVAVILDCLDDSVKAFYQRWDFAELPGHPYRLFLSAQTLSTMMRPR